MMTMVQGMSDVVHGLLFALVCGSRQIGGQHATAHLQEGSAGARRAGEVDGRCTTLSSGQMLLPGIAEPYRWEFGGKQ